MSRTCVVVVAFVAAGAAVAQPGRPPAPAGVLLVTRLPSHLHDAALVAELKLTPEQVKTLSPRGPSKAGPPGDAPASAGTRVKEALTPEQYARAVQLMAQDALRAGRGGVATPAALVAVPVSTLRRYPELADAAKLTREQRRRVTAAAAPPNPNFGGQQPTDASYGGLPTAAHVLLEPEQTAALAAFVGPLRAAPFGTAPPPMPVGGGTVRSVPSASSTPWQRAMTAVNNRGELKLTDEQATTLTNIMNSARGIVRAAPDGTVPTPPRQQTPAETEAALAKALNAEQMTRLKQIELWQQVPPGADATGKFDIPRVASEVALDDDQMAALKAVAAAHREKAAAALRSAKTAEDLRVALAAARADTAAGVETLLTDEQRTTLRDLFGAEYRGGGGGGRPDNDIFRRIRAASYGCYQFEIMLVNGRFGGVAEDLRLTEEQKTAMATAERDFNQTQRQGLNYEAPEHELAKQMAAQSKVMQKSFDDVLNPVQKKRFRELCIQARQALSNAQLGGGNGGMYPMTGVPGVADELKLTPDQRKRIVETGDEDATLTAEQRSQLTRMTGVPLAGGFNFGGPSRGRPAPPSARLALLYAGTAHADLRLTAEQTHLIAETIEVHAAELRPATTGRTGEFGGYVEPPQPDAVADTVAACEKACHSVLTAAQRRRLGQLVLQAAAEASLTAAFARPEVAEKLAFTAEQRAALADIGSDFRARVAAVNGLPNSVGWPELRRQALTDARAAARARLTAVLTAEQSAAWGSLTGPPCPAVAALPPSGDDTRDP